MSQSRRSRESRRSRSVLPVINFPLPSRCARASLRRARIYACILRRDIYLDLETQVRVRTHVSGREFGIHVRSIDLKFGVEKGELIKLIDPLRNFFRIDRLIIRIDIILRRRPVLSAVNIYAPGCDRGIHSSSLSTSIDRSIGPAAVEDGRPTTGDELEEAR